MRVTQKLVTTESLAKGSEEDVGALILYFTQTF